MKPRWQKSILILTAFPPLTVERAWRLIVNLSSMMAAKLSFQSEIDLGHSLSSAFDLVAGTVISLKQSNSFLRKLPLVYF